MISSLSIVINYNDIPKVLSMSLSYPIHTQTKKTLPRIRYIYTMFLLLLSSLLSVLSVKPQVFCYGHILSELLQ
ncbi:hypothetical protein MCHI_001464 [Candidatus Magnetoovum chiemensis]|nr:hypothetical protein MCHI_001464 [Candidatus Magnetoovum chiemensis]